MSEYDSSLAQGSPNSDGDALPPESPDTSQEVLVFRDGDKEYRVPRNAKFSSKSGEYAYEVAAGDLESTYLPKAFGFERRMRELANKEKELKAKFGEENMPLIEAVLSFKKERLNGLPREEQELLRRYLSGDPNLSATDLIRAQQGMSRQMAQQSSYDPYDEYGQPQQPQIPDEVRQALQEASKLHGELEQIKSKLAQKEQEDSERQEAERWSSLEDRIRQRIESSPVLKKIGPRVRENIMMKYLTMKGPDGDPLHDLDLSVNLAEQEAREELGRFGKDQLDSLLEDQRTHTSMSSGGIPASSPSNVFDEALKKMGPKPVARRGGMSAIGKHILEEYREAERQRGRPQ